MASRLLARLQMRIAQSCIFVVVATSLAAADPEETERSTERDRDTEVEVAKAACDSGSAAECLHAAAEIAREHIGSQPEDAARDLRRRGFALFAEQCDGGSAEACLRHGELLLASKRDAMRAIGAIERACELESGAACQLLGEQYSAGKIVRKDNKRALAMFERACGAGIGRACDELADRLAAGNPGKDAAYRRRIADLHEQACSAADREGCTHSAEQKLAEGDRSGAYTDLYQACELDDDKACLRAAALAPPNHARVLFLRACNGGLSAGCSQLADLFATGSGGERNWRRALQLAEKACTIDDVEPCAQAVALQRKRPDWRCTTEEACERLCAEGIGRSCRHLAELREDSTDLYERACAERDGESCTRRGHAATTLELAAKWYARGCAAGDRTACTYRDYANAIDGLPKALDSVRKRCGRDRNACVLLGLAIAERQASEAQRLWREACDRKHGVACRLLARDSSDKESKALMKRACKLGDGAGCESLAQIAPARRATVPAWL